MKFRLILCLAKTRSTFEITLVQIRIWNCEEEKAEHLIA